MGKEKRRRKLISARKAFRLGMAIGDAKCAAVAAMGAASVSAIHAAKFTLAAPAYVADSFRHAQEVSIHCNDAGKLMTAARVRCLLKEMVK